MILYYADTYYQLMVCYFIKEMYHKNDRNILAASSFMLKRCPNSAGIKELFSEVYELEYIPVDSINENFMEKARVQIEKIPYELQSYEKKYIAATHTWIGIYLAEIKEKFFLIEESNGILSKLDKLRSNVRLASEKQDRIACEMGLYDGTSECIEGIFGSDGNDNYWLLNERFVPISFQEKLESLSEEQLDKLIRVFSCEKIDIASENSTVVLTQHFANLGIMSWEEQKELYKILLDFFVDEESEVIIKPHPSDIMPYESLLNNVTVIKTIIPSELLAKIFTKEPKRYITVSSTAIDIIGKSEDEKVSFDFQYEKNYKVTITYYAALAICESYLQNEYQIYEYMTYEKIMSNLGKYGSGLPKIEIKRIKNQIEFEDIVMDSQKKIVLIDNVNNETIKEDYFNNLSVDDSTILIFLNTDKEYNFLRMKRDLNWEKGLHVVTVNLEGKTHGEAGRLYVYSKKGVADMKEIKKKLLNEQAILYTELFEGEENKIKVLEGVIKSTEKRLQFYMERERELLDKIDSLE